MTLTRPLFALYLSAACWAVWSPPAEAYPSCAIFAPTGNVMAGGQGQLSFYNAYYGTLTSTWAGLEVGLLPELPFGNSGLIFGGLEVGFDVIGEHPEVKPIVNAKLGLLRESGWVPDLGLGIMSVGLNPKLDSLTMAFFAASKTLTLGERELGRATLGYGKAMPTNPDQFSGTWPLPTGNQNLMVAYEFPSVGPFSFAVDHVGGDSEVSGTNVVMNVELVPGTYASVGYSFGHDRKDPVPDAYFFQTYTNFDFAKAFGKPAPESGNGT